MKTLLISALALGAMTSVALAEPGKLGESQAAVQQAAVLAGPVALTEAQMDSVTAGTNHPVIIIIPGSERGSGAGAPRLTIDPTAVTTGEYRPQFYFRPTDVTG